MHDYNYDNFLTRSGSAFYENHFSVSVYSQFQSSNFELRAKILGRFKNRAVLFLCFPRSRSDLCGLISALAYSDSILLVIVFSLSKYEQGTFRTLSQLVKSRISSRISSVKSPSPSWIEPLLQRTCASLVYILYKVFIM